MEKKLFNKFVTHRGTFHCDDVMSTAILGLIFGIKYVQENTERVSEPTQEDLDDPRVLVYDIGREYDTDRQIYDHHQPTCPRRNGKMEAAVSLLWQEFGYLLAPNNIVFENVLSRFIDPIAWTDNGEHVSYRQVVTISHLVSTFNEQWNEDGQEEPGFWMAVKICMQFLHRQIKLGYAKIESREMVLDAKRVKNCVILHKHVKWQEWLFQRNDNHLIDFVILPSHRGGYNLHSVFERNKTNSMKKLISKEWLECQPEGCRFVHTGRFIAAFDTIANILKAV